MKVTNIARPEAIVDAIEKTSRVTTLFQLIKKLEQNLQFSALQQKSKNHTM